MFKNDYNVARGCKILPSKRRVMCRVVSWVGESEQGAESLRAGAHRHQNAAAVGPRRHGRRAARLSRLDQRPSESSGLGNQRHEPAQGRPRQQTEGAWWGDWKSTVSASQYIDEVDNTLCCCFSPTFGARYVILCFFRAIYLHCVLLLIYSVILSICNILAMLFDWNVERKENVTSYFLNVTVSVTIH